jgi:F0F1-type ATP synthase membrane subunit b/b'
MKRLILAVFLTLTALSAQENAEKSETAVEENMLLKWANFVILAGGLGYLITKTLPSFLRTRTAEIQHGISEAQAMKQQAEKLSADMDARLSALGADIEKFRTQARSEMEQEGARIREETARQIARLQEQAAQEIERTGKVARQMLKTYAAKLSLDLAEQNLRTRVDAPAEAGLVNDFVSDLVRDRGSAKN